MGRGRLAEYRADQAAKLLHVSDAQFRWSCHTKIVPLPNASDNKWTRAAVEAMDPAKIIRAMPEDSISVGFAADLIAACLGFPNPPSGRPTVKVFTVERFVARKLLTSLSWDHNQVNPAQVAKLCLRKDIWDLIDAETPLGPDQSASRLRIRRADWDHIVRLGWIKPAQWRKVQFGTSKAGAVDVPIYRSADVDEIPHKHKSVDWEQLRSLGKGQRSPLAKLT